MNRRARRCSMRPATGRQCRPGTNSCASTPTGYRLAYRLSGNQHDAEDLTQETFIRVFRPCKTTSRAPSRAGCTASPRTCSWTWSVGAPDPDGGPARGLRPARRRAHSRADYHDARLGADLQAALDSLPPEFRAGGPCDIEGLSYEEIGATLGVKPGYRAQPHPPGPPSAAGLPAAHGRTEAESA